MVAGDQLQHHVHACHPAGRREAAPVDNEEVAAHLGQPLCAVTIRRFADGELFVKIDENVRGRDVYIIQPTNPPAENMIELLLLMDAAKRASAARVTSVIRIFWSWPVST